MANSTKDRFSLGRYLGKFISLTGCGGEIKGKSYGDISSPDYPSYVSKPVVCEWTITTTPGTSVSVLVQTIVIDPTAANCDRNSLKVGPLI